MSIEPVTCEKCEKPVAEVCPDGYCRACHVSITFDDCCSGKDFERRLAANGRTLEGVR